MWNSQRFSFQDPNPGDLWGLWMLMNHPRGRAGQKPDRLQNKPWMQLLSPRNETQTLPTLFTWSCKRIFVCRNTRSVTSAVKLESDMGCICGSSVKLGIAFLSFLLCAAPPLLQILLLPVLTQSTSRLRPQTYHNYSANTHLQVAKTLY